MADPTREDLLGGPEVFRPLRIPSRVRRARVKAQFEKETAEVIKSRRDGRISKETAKSHLKNLKAAKKQASSIIRDETRERVLENISRPHLGIARFVKDKARMATEVIDREAQEEAIAAATPKIVLGKAEPTYVRDESDRFTKKEKPVKEKKVKVEKPVVAPAPTPTPTPVTGAPELDPDVRELTFLERIAERVPWLGLGRQDEFDGEEIAEEEIAGEYDLAETQRLADENRAALDVADAARAAAAAAVPVVPVPPAVGPITADVPAVDLNDDAIDPDDLAVALGLLDRHPQFPTEPADPADAWFASASGFIDRTGGDPVPKVEIVLGEAQDLDPATSFVNAENIDAEIENLLNIAADGDRYVFVSASAALRENVQQVLDYLDEVYDAQAQAAGVTVEELVLDPLTEARNNVLVAIEDMIIEDPGMTDYIDMERINLTLGLNGPNDDDLSKASDAKTSVAQAKKEIIKQGMKARSLPGVSEDDPALVESRAKYDQVLALEKAVTGLEKVASWYVKHNQEVTGSKHQALDSARVSESTPPPPPEPGTVSHYNGDVTPPPYDPAEVIRNHPGSSVPVSIDTVVAAAADAPADPWESIARDGFGTSTFVPSESEPQWYDSEAPAVVDDSGPAAEPVDGSLEFWKDTLAGKGVTEAPAVQPQIRITHEDTRSAQAQADFDALDFSLRRIVHPAALDVDKASELEHPRDVAAAAAAVTPEPNGSPAAASGRLRGVLAKGAEAAQRRAEEIKARLEPVGEPAAPETPAAPTSQPAKPGSNGVGDGTQGATPTPRPYPPRPSKAATPEPPSRGVGPAGR